jgi:hypothetical protein
MRWPFVMGSVYNAYDGYLDRLAAGDPGNCRGKSQENHGTRASPIQMVK